MVVKFNFLSKYLGMQTNVTMCLPSFSFADVMSDRKEVYVQGMKYQTLYLLHGGSGDDSDYVNFSNIVRYADDHKLAVVMPCDYNGEYTDVPKGPKYLKYIMEELIPLTRAFFPLSDKREDTFVGGLSMGAAGAMKIALTYPELFSAALILSGAARHKRQKLGFKASMLELPGYKHEWDFWDLILRKAIGEWLPVRHSAIYPGE